MERELLALLERFVAFETVTGNTRAMQRCLNWIVKTFFPNPRWGIVRGEVRGNPYLFLPCPKAKLLWFSHIDVVPGDPQQFSLKVKRDRIYGRGTVDMKGSELPFLLAYRDIVASGKRPQVALLLTSDEEIAGPSIPELLKRKVLRAPTAFTPDAGGDLEIIVEHKGVIWVDLIAKGKSAHAAYAWNGKNPIFPLAEALSKLRRAFPLGKGSDWKMTVTPTVLEGGKARNMVPASCRVGVDVRYPPEGFRSPKAVLQVLRKALPKGVSLEVRTEAPPLTTNPKHPMVQRVQEIAREVLRRKVPLGRQHGASDARYFQEYGIPAFIYGPRGDEPHGAGEWVSLSSMLAHYEISKRLLLELC